MMNKTKKNRGEAVRSDDYLFAGALVRTRANSRIDREALLRMADARDVFEICKMLPEYSIEPIYDASGNLDAEKTVTEYLSKEFDAVSKAMPQKQIIDFLKIPYDCHNLKALAKCDFRGRDNSEELLIDLGRVPAKDVISYVKNEDLSAFSENLASSYKKAKKAFAESGDPKLIDSILDSACYADMLSSVGAYRNSYFKDLVKIKIDTTNFMTAVRTIRMGDRTGLFESMFISGSDLTLDYFKKAMANGEDSLFAAMKKQGYGTSCDSKETSLTQLTKAFEDIYMRKVNSAKDIPFGAEVCVCYLIKASHAMKLFRTLFAAKQAGIESSKIKEKIGNF